MNDLPPLTPEMRNHMASVASDRAKGWECVRQAVAPATADFVAQLRDGTWVSRLLDSMAWTNEGGERLVTSARMILPYERGAAARSAESDLVELSHGNPGDEALATSCARQRDWCQAEADSWRSGDEEAGRKHRLQQFTDLDTSLLDRLLDHLSELTSGLHSDIHVVIARILTAFLVLESGRNLPDPR